MLKEIYEQPEAVAETIGDRVRHGTLVLEGLGLTGQDDPGSPPHRHRRLRDRVPRRRRRALRDRGVGARPGRARHRERVALPESGASTRHDSSSGSRSRARRATRSGRCKLARERGARTRRDHEHDGLADHPRGRLRALHAGGLEMGVAASKTFTAQVALLYLVALKLAQVRETLPRGGDRVHPRCGLRAARRRSAYFLDGDHPIEEIAQRYHDALLPLPRAPHRPAGRARGRAEAEGDLVHPDRGVLRGRDEARADRAARRADARRRRRDEHPRLRQDRLEHPGGAGARRARHRDRDRRQRGHPAPRRRRHLRADDARFLQASLAVVPLQLLAYRIARLRGLNVDQPRNLAKTVTVE